MLIGFSFLRINANNLTVNWSSRKTLSLICRPSSARPKRRMRSYFAALITTKKICRLLSLKSKENLKQLRSNFKARLLSWVGYSLEKRNSFRTIWNHMRINLPKKKPKWKSKMSLTSKSTKCYFQSLKTRSSSQRETKKSWKWRLKTWSLSMQQNSWITSKSCFKWSQTISSSLRNSGTSLSLIKCMARFLTF